MNKAHLFLLSEATDDALTKLAKSRHASRSAVIRQLIEAAYGKLDKTAIPPRRLIVRERRGVDDAKASPYKPRVLLLPPKVNAALSALTRYYGVSRSAVLRMLITAATKGGAK